MKIPSLLLLAACTGLAAQAATADDAKPPSRHQLMKECVKKQKEADSGKLRDEVRAFCEDWVKTQRDAAKNAPPKD